MNRALNVEIFQRMYILIWLFYHPLIFQSLMANMSLIVRAKGLKIEELTKLNKFF